MASLQVNFPQRTFPRVKPGEVVSASLLNFYSRAIAAAYRNFRGGIFADSDDAPPPARENKNAPWTISAELDDDGKIRWDCIPGRIFGGDASTNYVVPEVLNDEPQDGGGTVWLIYFASSPYFDGVAEIAEKKRERWDGYYKFPPEDTYACRGNWAGAFRRNYIAATERCVVTIGGQVLTSAAVKEIYGGREAEDYWTTTRSLKSVRYGYERLGIISKGTDDSVSVKGFAFRADIFAYLAFDDKTLGIYYA